MEKLLCYTLFLLGVFYELNCFQTYVTLIPNGSNVTDPCNADKTISGVGHLNSNGGGDRNQFGLDFASNDRVWNSTLCNMDSDNDGITNGAELGDVNCLWVASDATTDQYLTYTGITHPGMDQNNVQC
ncbi:hypothetical protein KUTeg_002101 [Tegillarca granosa]|uniref:Temptin Cys/Cys disulfide domain-containing protein n=1 Tax=Tegillarca granosa TaxID=220873 RepID=A0ABQ9FTC9_TEGGR|nr:hypothetical protein KUTeg_002101 [Tegillarca granosa]